jgi:hypothetical protein
MRVRDFARAPVFGWSMRRFLLTVACAWAVLALAAAAATAATEPVVSTGNATAITSTSATLNGTVNPEGQATTYYFEYGTTTSYGSQTATADAGSGTANVAVSAQLASLTPDTTYHYRLVAINSSGTTLGSDVSFKTPKPPVPVVATGHPRDLTQTSATLSGTIDPDGLATSYVFQYGTSTAYGSETPVASAGSGTKNVAVSAAIGGLTPNTTYHYRLGATYANGTTYGHDVSFKTAPLPAGVMIAALPGTVTFGQTTSLSGRVLTPRPSHLVVTLQSAPGAGGPWIDAATTVAAATGAYSFPSVAPASNTYYRALADGTTSPTVLVSVRFRVGLLVSRRHPPRGTMVRFRGHVGPGHNGLRAFIQWLGPRGHWHTIKRPRLRGAGGGLSFYSVLVRIERGGRYRVVVGPDSGHAAGSSQVVRIRVA